MNADTLLHRQINPGWLQEGGVTSQAFKPTPKDEKQLSVYDGDQLTAEKAWSHYTRKLGHASVGVQSVTVAECAAQQLTVVPDPKPFPEHVLIDFTGHSESQLRKTASHLRNAAAKRGWQYRAEGERRA